MINGLIYVLVILIGASIGSFLSVVIYRIKAGEKGIIFGQSYCPMCKKNLSITDMIPIASFIILRGKCRKCKKNISPYYFFLEVVTGLVFLTTYLKFPFVLWLQNGTPIPDIFLLTKFIFYSIYGVFLIAIFFYDLQTKEIPEIFLFPFIILAIIGTIVTKEPILISAIIAVIISFIFFGGQIFLSKGKWLGEGDLYIGIAVAIILGWEKFILFIVLTYLIGSVISVPLLITKKTKLKSEIPFAPFMILSSFICIFLGENIVNWYLNGIIF